MKYLTRTSLSTIGALAFAGAFTTSSALAQGAASAAPATDGFGGAGALNMPIPPAAKLVAITHATILTASHGTILDGTIIIRDGKIAQVGAKLAAPAGAQVIDATGKFVTPGIIDAHSHSSLQGINESSSSITSQVNIGDAFRQDGLTLYRQLAGGVTAANVLHGSANTIGGQNLTVKMRFGLPVDSMKFDNSL